jgi:integrase
VQKKEISPLDESQISAFLSEIHGHPHEYLYKIALFTGLREGEILGLTWDHIDFEHGKLTVKQQLRKEQKKGGGYYFSPPKNNKTRVLTLAPSVVQLFRYQKLAENRMRVEAGDSWTENDLVFSNQLGSYLSYRTVYDCFKRIMVKIGSPNTRFHDLRHSYAVAAIQAGDDIKTVQENLGHATAAFTLDVYGHVTAQMKQASAGRMEQFIRSVSGG